MRACAVWLHHQHTAEKNLLDRTGAARKDDEYCAGSADAAVAIGQLQRQLSHYSLVALPLQALCSPKCDF